MMVTVPKVVKSKNLNEFISLLLSASYEQEVTIDLTRSSFIEIAPILGMLTIFKSWSDEGKKVLIRIPEGGDGAYCYLQRMNFFKLCGINLAERFTRQPEKAKFVSLQEIDVTSSDDILASKMAECISPPPPEGEFEFTDQPPTDEGYQSAITYALSELIRNVQQHSGGKGFAGAQKYNKSGRTQITIADIGMGIRESFVRSQSPFALQMHSDMDALDQAFKARVSSKTHQRNVYGNQGHENSGVGLTLLKSIAEQSGGEYALISGNATKSQDGGFTLDHNMRFPGTFAQFTFLNNNLDHFEDYLENAKKDAKIDGDDAHTSEIEKLFR